MTGSIGNLAEQVLQEVKGQKIVKLAQHRILQESQDKPVMHTEVGKNLMKLAEDLRNESDDVTVAELETFLNEAANAS